MKLFAVADHHLLSTFPHHRNHKLGWSACSRGFHAEEWCGQAIWLSALADRWTSPSCSILGRRSLPTDDRGLLLTLCQNTVTERQILLKFKEAEMNKPWRCNSCQEPGRQFGRVHKDRKTTTQTHHNLVWKLYFICTRHSSRSCTT